MADTKLTNLLAASTLVDTDLLLAATDIGTTPVSKKITVANARAALVGTTTVPGIWQNVPYVAGNYFAAGGTTPTWTVDSGDQQTYAYTQIGKTVMLSLAVATSSVGGSGPTSLRVTLPAGILPARLFLVLCRIQEGATDVVGRMYVFTGQNWIYIEKLTGAAFAAATNTTLVQGSITFEMQ